MKYPPSIPDLANPALMIRHNHFVFGTKFLKKIQVVSNAFHHFLSIRRHLSVSCMHYDNVLKDFTFQWKLLDDRKDEDEPDVPQISKTLNDTNWSEALIEFAHRMISVIGAPLVYMVKDDSVIPATSPPLLMNQPHSEEHRSVEEELINRLKHISPVFKDTNQKVYHSLEEATRGTAYASSVRTLTSPAHQ